MWASNTRELAPSMWMLGTKPKSSVRTWNSLNLGAISSVPVFKMVCICVSCVEGRVYALECRCLWNPEDGARAPVSGVTGFYEPLAIGSGNPSLVLWKSSTSF